VRHPILSIDTDLQGYASIYSSDSAEDSERERVSKGRIGKMARKRFESTLRSMSGKRVQIARAMEFALKRAEAADEVCHVSFSTHDLASLS
jgi:U2-associated protein SR140